MTDKNIGCSAAPPTCLRQLREFFRAALSHANGSLIALAALLGSVRVAPILLSYWVGRDSGPPSLALYRLVPAEIIAACMLVAVLAAEQCVRNGMRRLTAYIPAVTAAALLSGLISGPLIVFMHDPRFPVSPDHWYAGMAGIALFISADALARGGLVAFIFANRERWLTSVRHLREAELERAQIEQNLAESRLNAFESMLPLPSLIAGLEAVGSLYDRDRAHGDRQLAEFIDHLRSVTASIHI
jgi:hypothetical protein